MRQARLTDSQVGAILMLMRAMVRAAGLLGCVAALSGFVPALAAARDHAGAKPVVWHLHWTRFFSGPGAGAFVQDGPWVYVPEYGSSGVLFNLTAGTSTQLTAPSQECSAPVQWGDAMGGGWLKVDCGANTAMVEDLYSLGTGTWSIFDPSVAIQRGCGPNSEDECEITSGRIGRDWLEFSFVYNIPTSPGHIGWENLNTQAWKQTGGREERIPGLGPTTMLDLNSPSLLAPVCSPIRLPFGGRLIGSLQGIRSPVLMLGQFAMVGDPYNSDGLHPHYGRSDYTYLERCGQRHRRVLTQAEAADSVNNGRVLIWADYQKRQLAGMYVGSGQRFVASLGTPGADGAALAGITPQDVIQASNSGLWYAPLPKGAWH
jgi:hypothetical protein